jgi:glycosyltransferase involved in cell wall biosynthesis
VSGAGLAARLPTALKARLRSAAYRWRLARGREIPDDAIHAFVDWPPQEGFCVELRLPAGIEHAVAAAFCARQTLRFLRAVGLDAQGREQWRVGETELPARYWLACADLPAWPPAFLESALAVAKAEVVDAVVFGDRLPGFVRPSRPEDLFREPWRSSTLFACDAFADLGPAKGLEPKRERWVAKVVGGRRLAPGRHRRWDYLASFDLGPRPAFQLRAASRFAGRAEPRAKPCLLVTVPFFARGGVEHTLLETLRHLRDRVEPIFVSLAPHRPELGDRRIDFEQIGPRLLALGDLMHPAAMPDLLDDLIATYQPFAWYNANATTLFYDFVPRMKARWPQLRILDHLYDHRVGYIERYADPALRTAIDACIAENARIATRLEEDFDWPADRAPVVWPCGRRLGELPAPEHRPELRRRLRAELGIPEDALVFLTAARMHSQKRPLDLPALALRVRDLNVFFLVVGGGDLEDAVDAAIGAAVADGAAIRRLPFRDDIPALIVAADVGCLVSAYEGLPIFLLECLQLDRPFLGTDVGALGDVLRATGAGWVVDQPGDLGALEAAVREIGAPGAYAACAKAAHAAAPRFGVEICAERYHHVFRGEAL